MIVLGATVYFRTDEKGFTFIETDGYPNNDPTFVKIREALRGLQTDDDREMEQVLRESERSRANRNLNR